MPHVCPDGAATWVPLYGVHFYGYNLDQGPWVALQLLLLGLGQNMSFTHSQSFNTNYSTNP